MANSGKTDAQKRMIDKYDSNSPTPSNSDMMARDEAARASRPEGEVMRYQQDNVVNFPHAGLVNPGQVINDGKNVTTGSAGPGISGSFGGSATTFSNNTTENLSPEQQVINLKKEWDRRNKANSSFRGSDEAKALSAEANAIREKYGLSSSIYGSGSTLTNAKLTYHDDNNISSPQEAANRILEYKEMWSRMNQDDPNFRGSQEAKDISARADAIRQRFGLSDDMYGSGVGMGDASSNYYDQFKYQDGNNLDDIGDFYGQSRDDYIAAQTAQIEKAYAQEIANLESAYAEAVAEGRMSVREAEKAFEEQKGVIEQQSYLDNEALRVHAQQRGIQNSQQLLGLEMGAASRTTSMISDNMSERDKRVADIKDRINTLTLQKDLAATSAQASRDYGIAGATAEGSRMYNESMGNMMQQDYFNRQGFDHDRNMQDQAQDFEFDKMDKSHKFDLDKMDVNQRHVLEQMAKAHGYDLNKMTVEQANTLEQMSVQHGYDLVKINQQFQNNVSLDKLKYSHDMNMSEKEFNQAKQMATHNSAIRVREERNQYNIDRKRKLDELGLGSKGENSPEFKIWEAQAQRDLDQKIKEINEIAMTEAMLELGVGSGGGFTGSSGSGFSGGSGAGGGGAGGF